MKACSPVYFANILVGFTASLSRSHFFTLKKQATILRNIAIFVPDYTVLVKIKAR
jgi:hypothetical protein